MKTIIFSLGVVTGCLLAKQIASEQKDVEDVDHALGKLYQHIANLKNVDIKEKAINLWDQMSDIVAMPLDKVKQKIRKKGA